MASPLQQPDFTNQQATQYKTAIDNAIAVFLRTAGAFSAQAQDAPDMTVKVNAGHVYDGSTLTEVAAQDTDTITAPSVDDRIDRVVLSNTDGSVSVVTGSEAPEPSAPAIPDGYVPCARVYLTPSHTEIANPDITDERSRLPGTLSADQDETITGAWTFTGGSSADFTELYEDGQRVGPIEEAIVELGGDFDAGEEVKCSRVGDHIHVSGIGGSLSHSTGSEVASASGVIPQSFRPDNTQYNVYTAYFTQADRFVGRVGITSSGTLVVSYSSFDGSPEDRGNTGVSVNISYLRGA